MQVNYECERVFQIFNTLIGGRIIIIKLHAPFIYNFKTVFYNEIITFSNESFIPYIFYSQWK